ncbi:MAG TPA: GNAT family N-acetyltransferase [Tepidisphaeraceae bacterium]|jgi:GNAT superfamily N-acetyltransferase|nr:GNAT family N-acetyltransferase [Tepidisphaeraceae bacterium]
MPDMLVKLYDLPPRHAAVARCAAEGITIRGAMPYEKTIVLGWIRQEFQVGWSDEADAAFARQPINCIIATDRGRVVGFAAHDATARGFFGPTGVQASHRNRGIGKALLLYSLHGMADLGYAYAIIGQAEEKARDFYAKAVGATLIPGSDPSIYRDWLKSS